MTSLEVTFPWLYDVEANITCTFRQIHAGSEGGCNTEIGVFIAKNHARIFKNVNYLETGLL
jgi:hypothetical protein